MFLTRKPLIVSIAIVAALIVSSAQATTFIVPPDREMVRRAHIVVIATAQPSYSQWNGEGGVETVTPMLVEEVIKGRAPSTLDVVEPGGTFGGLTMEINGIPRFESGTRLLLFLSNVGPRRWAATELVLGKFTFADEQGQQLLLRDADEITGWDLDRKPHMERARAADRFLQFVRTEAKGGEGSSDYFVMPNEPAPLPSVKTIRASSVHAAVAPYSANSYTSIASGSMGARWNVFPNPVTIYTGTQTEPGAPGGGSTAAATAVASWDNDCPSNVNYVYGGTDPGGTHTAGLTGPDGANTILFERDLSRYGVGPFTCTSNSYGGTLGIGGITNASGTHTLGIEQFLTTIEADVEMNRGIANCTLLFNGGEFNSAVTHEVGHTLGFRHSDQNRPNSAACSSDPTLECSSSAIMTAAVTPGLNGALQAWDQHAVQAVYPGGSCGPPPPPPCTPPSITAQPQSTQTTSGTPVNLSVGASGTAPLSYQWYTGASGNTGSPINGATDSTLTVSPTSTTSYWVRVTNSCGIANSATATIMIVAGSSRHVKSDFDGDGKTDSAVYRPSTGVWFINYSSTGATAQVLDGGAGGDIIVPADYDGDGKTDVAIFRPSRGLWYVINSSSGSAMSRIWGQSGDVPVPADFDGDGKADFVVWRPSTGVWYIAFSSGPTTTSLDGGPGDIPVPADYDGDGKADVAIFRPSNGMWYYISSRSGGASSFIWGGPDDIPVTADFDGDGKSDIAVWRRTTGVWYIRFSTGGSTTTLVGAPGDIPVPGDYDGDGRADAAIWRPSNGMWYFLSSRSGGGSAKIFGGPGDVPTTRVLTNNTGP